MKRALALLLLLALMLPVFCFSTSAEEYTDPKDSRHISPEISDEIDLEDTDFIIKCYVSYISHDFASYLSIDEILDKGYVRYIQRKLSDSQLHIYMTDGNGEYVEVDSSYDLFYSQTFDELQTGEAIKAVSSDIVIQSVYYLWGENTHSGTAIYYKTNLGDYVYYRQHWLGEKLFPAEVFFAYHRRNSIDGRANEVFDLSVYDYRSPSFAPHTEIPDSKSKLATYLWVGGIAIVIVGEVVFFIIRAKRKKNEEFEISEIE